MTISFNWTPEPKLLEKLVILARVKGESLDAIVNKAVQEYVENQPIENDPERLDPLIGLFKGSPNLATESEEILRREINSKSG